MQPLELVQLVKKYKPDLLKNITDKEATVVIDEVLLEISRHLDTINEGVIKVPKLGKFIIRQVGREKDGNTVITKKIAFIPARLVNKKDEDM